ncbi:IGS10 protein, partial [Urocolius indicus]|nr:IGS10 protein [Urocolius indicus]
EDGRILVLQSGTFTLRTADAFDSGLYHCVGTNDEDADSLTFRITVVDPDVARSSVNGAQLAAFAGSTLDLPCSSTAAPDAAISWVLPDQVVLQQSAGNKHVFDNGTLRIRGVTERDSGYFRCVAANQYGVDLLVFQVVVGKDKTTPKKKPVAVGEWEEGDGSGNAMLASAATQKHPLAPPAASTAHQASAASPEKRVAQSAHRRNGSRKVMYRRLGDKRSRRFRGHRRQFASSARRVDPQHWAAFLEKAKRNSTSTEKQEVATAKPPVRVRKLSKVPEEKEEASGDLSPEEEFMIPVAESTSVSAAGGAMGRGITAVPERAAGSSPAWKASPLVAEAVTPLPSPFAQSVSAGSRSPQTYQKPTMTNSWERSDLSQLSANDINQPTISTGERATSPLSPAGQRLVYSGESNNQQLNCAATRPTAGVTDTSTSPASQSTVDQLHVFTESLGEISTTTDHQVPVVTAGEPSPEAGHIYFHSTLKQVTPNPPWASTIINHQRIQFPEDTTTRRPQPQQRYGGQRRSSGRRRIVRPGHFPSIKEHRYDFGRPGSVRGSTAAGVQLNMKHVPHLPTLNNNLSSSISPFQPEAPLSPPSTMTLPSEHPVGTHPNTAFPREEEGEPGARQKAATAVLPFTAESTQGAPRWPLESSAPLQTHTGGIQPFSIRLPTTAIHAAHAATETAQTTSTATSPTLESVSPSIEPGTSPKHSQRGKITWEHLFRSGAQQELLRKIPQQRTEMFPSTQVLTVLPKSRAALSVSNLPPLHSMPVSPGGNHSSGVLPTNKPSHYSNDESEEDLPTAELPPSSGPATSATKDMDATSLKPTVTPVTAPQTDAKVTKSKTFRVGRKRGQRKKRPPKTSTLGSVAAGHAAIPSGNVATTIQPFTLPPCLTPTEPVSESPRAVPTTPTPALWVPSTPAAAPQPSVTTSQQRPVTTLQSSIPWAMVLPSSRAAHSPTDPLRPTLRLSVPPTMGWAVSGEEPAQQSNATAPAGEEIPLEMAERVTQENPRAQPTAPARAEPGAPAATTDPTAPRTPHVPPP